MKKLKIKQEACDTLRTSLVRAEVVCDYNGKRICDRFPFLKAKAGSEDLLIAKQIRNPFLNFENMRTVSLIGNNVHDSL